MSKESQEKSDMRHIRFFKGSVKDFKQMFDDLAGQNTNAYDTPEYQGFNDVHPVRGNNKSKHWESSNIESELSEGAVKDLMQMIDDGESDKDILKAFPKISKKDLIAWKDSFINDEVADKIPDSVVEAAPKIKFSKFVEELGEAWVIIEKTENQMKFEDPNGYAKCKKEWKAIDKASYNLAMAIKRHGKNY